MPGTVATNPHQGSRAEVIADYLFSGWGTVTPVRRQDDHGVDLYCTLTENIGRRSVVTDYYSVQVKNGADPWVFKDAEEIKWLFDYSTPLFLACVDQGSLTLSVYQTLPRFLARMAHVIGYLELMPAHDEQGIVTQWPETQRISLSAPIIRATLEDIARPERLTQLKSVLGFWIAIDRQACDFARMGLMRLRTPAGYRPNEVPSSAVSEIGSIQPTTEQFAVTLRNTLEVLDCVGYQLLQRGDVESALYATLLFRRIRERNPHATVGIPTWRQDVMLAPLERTIAMNLNRALHPERSPTYYFEALDAIASEIRESENFARCMPGQAPE